MMAPPVRSEHYDDDDGPVDDFSRADLMTPFSLSLAAERAIENAKRNLDAMDARLLHAKSSVARAQRIGLRAIPSVSPPVQHSEKSIKPGRKTEEHERKKTAEMRRLSHDLRNLRSRLSESRAIGETLNLTPPPPPRPPRPSAGELPDLALLAWEDRRRSALLGGEVLPTTADATRQRRWEADAVSPIVETVGRFVRSPSPSPSPVVLPSSSSETKTMTTTTMMLDNPFSPRPYSSQSVLAPWSPSPTISTSPTTSATPLARSTRSSGLSTATTTATTTANTSPGSTRSSEDARAVKTPPDHDSPARSSQRSPTSPTSTTSPSRIPRRTEERLSRRLAAVLSKVDDRERRRPPEGIDGERRRRLEAALDLIENIIS